ncbi:hypothetical protein MMC28_004154 [Mycoblastus sanguinarius]|nr:hypothetical protein [Mycoblastus sanguinarius]
MPNSGYAFTNDSEIQTAVSQRTANKEAAFVLPYLQLNSRILDVGCGPGSITCDFAALVPHGSVIGVDVSHTVVECATQRGNERNFKNIEFRVGNIVEGLADFADESFDIVFCHQLLTHVSDPVAAMKEMRRLVKSSEGIVATRESLTILWYPSNPVLEGLTRWLPRAFRAASGANEGAGERVPHILARRAGFDEECMANGVGAVVRSTRREREIGFKGLQDMMAEGTSFHQSMVEAGATQKDFDDIKRALEEWMDNVDGWNMWLSSEMICNGALNSVVTE